jgi:hypothetical protein
MSSNRIKYQSKPHHPMYSLSKGRKPKDEAICNFSDGSNVVQQYIDNEHVLATMKPVARVQSRHRVSPSPRKIPNYEMESIIDKLAVLNPIGTAIGQVASLSMIMTQRNSIRRNLPRFR